MGPLIHAAGRLFNRPLLCTATYASAVATALADRLNIEPLVSQSDVQSYVRPAFKPALNSGIATYPIVGSMVHRGGYLEAASGMQSYTQIQNDIAGMIADPKVRGILLDLDTPGGEAAGIVETAAFIQQAARSKPIWAIANTSACSGGYWLAAACSRIVAAPMASVGSIGVVTMHQDVSAALEKRGVVTTMIYAGQHKVDGNPYGALPPDVKAAIQADIDGLYATFIAAVSDMRGLDQSAVRATEADVFGADDAYLYGLVDGRGTLGETLASFARVLDGGTP